MKEPLNAASLHLSVPRQRRQWSSYSRKGPRRFQDRPHSSRRPRHGRKRSWSQGGAERPSPRLRSTGEGAERTRKKQAACRRAHRPSRQPTIREEPQGQSHRVAQSRANRGKARASKASKLASNPSPSGRERVKDCRQTAERLSVGPSAAKPDGVAVTPKRKRKKLQSYANHPHQTRNPILTFHENRKS